MEPKTGTKFYASDDFPTAVYAGIGFIVGIIVFIGIWIYAVSEWGLLFGLVFGWIPALIGAFLVGFLWPFILIGGIILFIYASRH